MNLIFRTATLEDARAAGSAACDAFKSSADRHGHVAEFQTAEVTGDFFGDLFAHANVHAVVAELDGCIAGSSFLWEYGEVAGVGPVTVDPRHQNERIGHGLMETILGHASARGIGSIRLVQIGYHMGSLALYTGLGFVVREPLVVMQGRAPAWPLEGRQVRAAGEDDVVAASDLFRRVHGFARTVELRESMAQGTAFVLEHDGRVCGYTTGVGFFGHSVGETTADLMALISSAPTFPGPGFLVPTRNAELLRWCLRHGLRIVQPMTLMSMGRYDEPSGAFLPSILY